MVSYRWWVVVLLFLGTTINYLDRILFSVLIPVIRQEMQINDKDYGFINGAFQIAYTAGFLFMGKFIDHFGTRIGYAFAAVWWSISAMMHSLAGSGLSLGFWRGMLGLGEAGNFPAGIKAVAEWFPKEQRALATGWFNAGSNVASMIGPPLFVWITAQYGWRTCFIATASLVVLWLPLWWFTYRTPPDAPAPQQEPSIGWTQAFSYRETWGFALAKFFTDPVWWFYLYWLPPYLYDVRKFDLKQIGWALPFIYLMADFGSVGGGWISGFLIRRGWPNGKARKAAMAVCAGLMPVAACAALVEDRILAVFLVSIATAAHQGWSANLYTTTSDVFPRAATASVTGIGGCLGGLGGVLFSAVIPGYVVTHFGYTPVFLTMGFFHLAALALVHWLLRDMRPVGNS
ncbi:MAG: MFS transporter [Acidobacteria bacterium]|nr:MFS transporter [Acidobacteriota bacterium]